MKKIILIIALGVVLVFGLVIFWGSRRPKGISVPITPSQLSPTVSLAEAKITICNTKKEGLFTQACPAEKLPELLALFKQVEADGSLSDYDRLLLSQVIFAALPNKDNPSAARGFSFPGKKIAYALDVIMSEAEFKNLMAGDLGKVLELPQGNNAWVINIMVSKYHWVDGVRQPIYADQYAKSFNPYPGVSTEIRDQSKITYNIRSTVGSRATSEAIYSGPFKGTGEMIVYSFTMMSWYSPPYGSDSVLTKAEAGPDAKDLTSRQDRSEAGYSGENYLSDLLNQVKLPSWEPPKKGGSKLTLFGGKSELDCQELWEDLSKDMGTRLAVEVEEIPGAEWKFSSTNQVAKKDNGSNCDLTGEQYDTDSEHELKNSFDYQVTYFADQDKTKAALTSQKAGETAEPPAAADDKYSLRTFNLGYVDGRSYLADGNHARTVGIKGNCLLAITQTWWATAHQWNLSIGDAGREAMAASLMDGLLESSKNGWQTLSEAKAVRQFCGGN